MAISTGVYSTLVSYYSRQFLLGNVGTQRGSPFARRPGGFTTQLGRDEQVRARDWAEQQALTAARDLFEKRVCVDCHEVARMPELPGIERWKVVPVKLTQTWMPRARFNHEAHKTTQCAACHTNSNLSKKSSDVLMPTIAECRTCHGGLEEKGKLPSVASCATSSTCPIAGCSIRPPPTSRTKIRARESSRA